MGTNHEQEIDLIEVLKLISQKIAVFFHYLKNLSLFIIYFVIKNIFIYLIVFVLSFGLSYLYFNYGNKQFYRSTLIASSNVVSNAEIINIINSLKSALSENGKGYLAKQLGCSKENIDKLNDLQACWLIDRNRDGLSDYVDYDNAFNSINPKTDTMTARVYSEFAIKIDYTDINVIPVVKKGIIEYLKRNPYIQERDSLKRRQLYELIKKTDAELKDLDTLVVKYNSYVLTNPLNGKDLKSQILMVNEKELKLLYPEALKLFQQKQSLELTYALTTKDVITIKTDFIPSLRQQVGIARLNLYTLIFFSIAATIGIIIFQKRKRLKDIFKNAENEIFKKKDDINIIS